MADRPSALPDWAREIAAAYESGSASQFILYGNIHDQFCLPGEKRALGSLTDFFLHALMPHFDVILSYDLGSGIRIEKGREAFAQWPGSKEHPDLPKSPRPAIELLTRYLRYLANVPRWASEAHHAGCIINAAHLIAPGGATGHDVSAIALLLRDWATDPSLARHALATFLLADNLNDLHPLLAANPRAVAVKIPLPDPHELETAFNSIGPSYPLALANYEGRHADLARQMRGATLTAIESQLKRAEHAGEPLREGDIASLRRRLVERECEGLIEFIEPTRTLDDLYGQPRLKEMLRQDFTLWRQGDIAALPMGYLVCGPVGTGKTYLVECLAGEANVPVVKLKNFRDKWIGSTEGNLEKVFRLLHALGRCFVFIDEADQALGRRDTSGHDGGLSGRIYSMFATEMSQPENRGRIIWVLATSRPDLVEVDLKRPGRIDVKLPLFPTMNPAEGVALLRALCRRRGVEFPDSADLESSIPELLTPGAADALAMKIYRHIRADGLEPVEAVRRCLRDYRPPVPLETLQFQMRLAIDEASDIELIPEPLR